MWRGVVGGVQQCAYFRASAIPISIISIIPMVIHDLSFCRLRSFRHKPCPAAKMSDFTQYGTPSEEWLAYASTVPAPPVGLTMLQRRKTMNEEREAIAAKGLEIWKSKVEIKDHAVPGPDGSSIEARTYRPSSVDADKILPAYIHLHGGGFFFGTLGSEDAICARIAANAQVLVLNVNYRHTPEHVYPAAWDDTAAAFEWLHDHAEVLQIDPGQVVMGGISAGAQLTASFALQQHLGKAAASRPRLAGQVLMIPCLVNPDCYGPQLRKLGDPAKSSYEQNKDAAILPMSVARFFTNSLKIEDPQVDDLRLNPGNASADDVRGLPPTLFGIAGWDILRDEGLLWAKLLTEAG